MSILKELAKNRKNIEFQKTWNSEFKQEQNPAESLEALKILNDSGETQLARKIAEKTTKELELNNSKNLFTFADGAALILNKSPIIAGILIESLRDEYLIFELLETFISASGIQSEKKPLKESWLKLKNLLRYQLNNFVYHKDFGPGEIVRISRASITIDFLRSKDHDMSVSALIESTSPISKDSLHIIKWKKPEEFQKMLSSSEEHFLTSAFIDFAIDNTLKEVYLLKLLEGSEIKPRVMWKTLKLIASKSSSYVDMGDSIIPADSSSLLSQIETIITLKKTPMSEKTKTVNSLLKASPRSEIGPLTELVDTIFSIKDIEKGAIFELAWLCSDKGKVTKFNERAAHLIENKAPRVQRALGEIHSAPCKKLYLQIFFASSPEEKEINILFDKLPRTLREQAADFALEFYKDLHNEYVLKLLMDPANIAHFMWALERAAKLEEYMDAKDIVELALKNLLFAKTDMQKRICGVLMNKLRPQLEQHISLLDTRRLDSLTKNLEESIGAQESGLVLLARRELSGRRTGGFTNIKKFWETDAIFCSREGITRRTDDMEYIRTEEIPLAAKAIAEAASHGDLSENAEYTAALEKRDFLLDMLNRYRKELKRMQPYPVNEISTDIISPATKVVIESMDSSSTVRTIHVVGLMDSNSDEGYINYKAPLGAALLGLSKGDTVQLPGAKNAIWRITDISIIHKLL